MLRRWILVCFLHPDLNLQLCYSCPCVIPGLGLGINTILSDYKSAWPEIRPQSNSRSVTYILWFNNLTYFLDSKSVWSEVWHKNKCRSQWPTFHSPVISPYILKSIWYTSIIFKNYESVWCRLHVGYNDFHFTVQWFSLISWRVLDV